MAHFPKIILASSSNEKLSLDFVENKDDIIFVCPNPVVADFVDELYHDNFPNRCKSITISKFSKTILTHIMGEDHYKSAYKGKAELLSILGTSWKRQFAEEASFKLFNQVFTVFTELRSYSLDIDVLEDVFKEYDETTQSSLKWFFKMMELTGFFDEHQGYEQITEYLRSIQDDEIELLDQNIVFMGFPFLTGVQVDMLKALGIRSHVFIPISEYLYSHSQDGDWPRWIEDVELGEKKKLPMIKAQIFKSPSRKHADALKQINFEKNIHFILAQSNPSYFQIQEVPYRDLSYKINEDLFGPPITSIFEKIKKSVGNENISIDEIFKYLHSDLFLVYKEKSEILYLKSVLIIKNVFEQWLELSDQNAIIGSFDLELLEEISHLNKTRNFKFNLVKKSNGAISGFEGLDFVSRSNQVVISASRNHRKILMSGSPLPRSVVEIISAISPVRRYRFEFLAIKEKVINILSDSSNVLLIDEEIPEIDSAWGEILEDIKLEDYPVVSMSKNLNMKKFLEKYIDKTYLTDFFSVSRIQTYIDCPRKFYFQYVENIYFDEESFEQLSYGQRGELQHEVIEYYVKSFSSYIENEHSSIVSMRMNKYIKTKNLRINNLNYQTYYTEIFIYSQKGIETLFNLLKIDHSIKFVFEKKFSHSFSGIKLNGRADCLVVGDYLKGIIDFKRSSSSVPSLAKIMAYEKIQLPFYYLTSKTFLNEINFVGYVDLSTPNKSVFLGNDSKLTAEIFESVGKHSITLKKSVLSNWTEYFLDFSDHLKKILVDISVDTEFRPNSSGDACKFCSISFLCGKEVK